MVAPQASLVGVGLGLTDDVAGDGDPDVVGAAVGVGREVAAGPVAVGAVAGAGVSTAAEGLGFADDPHAAAAITIDAATANSRGSGDCRIIGGPS
jgi:hypothetical protein